MPNHSDSTDALIDAAGGGDPGAKGTLLERYRGRLRRMVAHRIDPRLRPRVDASDVVQEALAIASARLEAFARDRKFPIYPWLSRIAFERLIAVRRLHRAGVRDVAREQGGGDGDDPTRRLADEFVGRDPTPGQVLIREERCQQVRAAIATLASIDREVLELRYLGDQTFPEIAETLGIPEGTAKMRHLRAVVRLREHLEATEAWSAP